jgi:virulence-associated protein VagC
VLALFRFKEMRPLAGISSLVDWRLHGHLSRLIIDGFFKGDAEESLLIPLGRRLPQEYLLVVGLGDRAGFTEKSFDSCLKKLFDTARGVNRSEIAVALPGRPERECDTLLIEPVEAQKVIIPVVERWRLRQLVPQSVKQDKLI